MVVSTKHISKHASSRSPTASGFFNGSERYTLWNFFPTFSYTSAVHMLIVVAILLALAFIVYKHVAKPSWTSSSQHLEKVRLYMAGSMVGDFTRRIFDYWEISSRQDTVAISNRDEKSRRLSDMTSSSSTSLSPTVLPTHNTSPRSYKKTRVTPHRRPSSRQKPQSQNIITEDSSISSNNDSHTEHSPTFTEQDETKTSVTINVADTLNSRTDLSSIDTCQESKNKIEDDQNCNNDTIKHTSENIDSWTESQQTPRAISNRYYKSRRLTSDLTFSESSIPSTNNSKLQRKNSLKENRKQNTHNSKEQTVILATQESDGEVDSIISDDHSDISIQQSDAVVPTIQKHVQDSAQEVKTERKKRRKRARGSKQKAQQNHQTQVSDHHSLKKQNISQQSAFDVSKSRHHQSSEISKSRQSVEKSKSANYETWERHSNHESRQVRSDPTVYFLQANKRTSQIYNPANSNGTAIPAKATLPGSNRKVFPRTDWKSNDMISSSHDASHNFGPITSSSNASISRFTTYADVIAPHNRLSALSRSDTSRLSNGNDIITPVPVASMNNTTNHQWYSPFGSGLSIQLTPPASPQNNHRSLPSTNSNAPYISKKSQDRNRNVIAPPPSFSSSQASSLSMFTSPSFSPFSDSLSNENQGNVITLPTNSSFRESLFGRKYPVQDQEKGELSDEADDSESWNKIMRRSELVNQKTQIDDGLPVRKVKFVEGTKNGNVNENAWIREQQESQQQFSLFDNRLSFIYPPRS